MILEYCPGKELYDLLAQQRKLSEPIARFYTTEIILALEYIHSKGIVYRDLKPENIVFDLYGHIKLIDFGLSEFSNTESTVSGSMNYISPEAIRKEPCSYVNDFYSLGVILYEMLIGSPPNYQKNSAFSDFDYIKKKISYPRWLKNSIKGLLKSLLEKDSNKRIGSKGIQEIKDHPWFDLVNWEDVEEQTITPPFIPSIEGERKFIEQATTYNDEDESEESD